MNFQEVIDAVNEEWQKKIDLMIAEIEKQKYRYPMSNQAKAFNITIDGVLDIIKKYTGGEK